MTCLYYKSKNIRRSVPYRRAEFGGKFRMAIQNALTHSAIVAALTIAPTASRSSTDGPDEVAHHELHIQTVSLEARSALVRTQTEYEKRCKKGIGEICADCDKPIPAIRREAMPYTTTCKACSQLREDFKNRKGRR